MSLLLLYFISSDFDSIRSSLDVPFDFYTLLQVNLNDVESSLYLAVTEAHPQHSRITDHEAPPVLTNNRMIHRHGINTDSDIEESEIRELALHEARPLDPSIRFEQAEGFLCAGCQPGCAISHHFLSLYLIASTKLAEHVDCVTPLHYKFPPNPRSRLVD